MSPLNYCISKLDLVWFSEKSKIMRILSFSGHGENLEILLCVLNHQGHFTFGLSTIDVTLVDL